MFDFIKKDKEVESKEEDKEINNREEEAKDVNLKPYDSSMKQIEIKYMSLIADALVDISKTLDKIAQDNNEIGQEIHLILGYMSQMKFAEEELVKSIAFYNALTFLDSQYNSSDSIMGIEEIKKYYEGIRNEIFIEYNQEYQERLKAQKEGEDK